MYDQAHTQAYINNDDVGGGLINAYTQQERLTAAFCVPYVCKKHKILWVKHESFVQFTDIICISLDSKTGKMKSIRLQDHKAAFLLSRFLMFHSPA